MTNADVRELMVRLDAIDRRIEMESTSIRETMKIGFDDAQIAIHGVMHRLLPGGLQVPRPPKPRD